MNYQLKILLASLVVIGVAQGCEDPEEPPPVAEVKPIESKPVPKKSQVAPLPLHTPPAVMDLLNSEDPERKREGGRRLGILLRECQRRASAPADDQAENRAKLQTEVLEKITQLGPLASGAIIAMEDVLKQDAPLELKQQILQIWEKSGAADKRVGPALAYVSRDPKLYSTAIRLMIQLGCSDPASVAVLGAALRNPEFLNPALEALLRLDDKTVIPASRFALEIASAAQQPLEIRIKAIEVIGKFSLAGVPDLSQLWTDDNPLIRKASMKLGIADGNLLVREKDPEVISAAFEGLARSPIHPEYVAQVLEQAIKQESLRSAVDRFLQEHPEKVVDILLNLFKSDSALIRDYSIDHFAALSNDEPIIASLQAIMTESEDPGLLTLASIKLGEVPQNVDINGLAESVSKWISHPKLQPQILALLKKLGSDAVPALSQLVTDSRLEPELKTEMLGILVTQPNAHAVAQPLLRAQLESEDPATRLWAAIAVAKLSAGNAEDAESDLSPIFQEAMKSPDQHILKGALEAIGDRPMLGGMIGNEILAALHHADPTIRIAAILSLTKIETKAKGKVSGALEALKKVAAEDTNADVKKQAEESVKQLEIPAS